MFDVVYIHDDEQGQRENEEEEEICMSRHICVFYKNRIRVRKLQTTKEDDV